MIGKPKLSPPRPDEEPDIDDVDDEFMDERLGCRFCGIRGHRFDKCPSRPKKVNDEGKWTW